MSRYPGSQNDPGDGPDEVTYAPQVIFVFIVLFALIVRVAIALGRQL